MPRVVIVSTLYGPPWNEGEKNIARVLAMGLGAHGFEASVVSRPGDPNFCRPPYHRFSIPEIRDTMGFWLQAAAAARHRGARVIHVLSSVSSALGLKCRILKRMSKAALLLHVTGLASPVPGYRILLDADSIVVGGTFLKKFFPDALDLPPISPNMNPDPSPWQPRAPGPASRILYLGAMEPVRGVHTLVDALARLDEQALAFDATIAWNGLGEGDYESRIRTRIAESGAARHVRWEGVATDLAALYREHDIVVIPRASQERMAFPLRLIEAMSYGRPVVVSDVGDMPAVADGCGLVFPRGDADRLAESLRMLMTDAALYQRSARRACERAADYRPARTVQRFANLYRDILPC